MKFAVQAATALLLAATAIAAASVLGGYLASTAISGWASSPVWLASMFKWLGSPPINQNYQVIVTTALTITGTLVTVYFATVTFVMSSTYKDTTDRVRALVTRSPGGRLYGFAYVQVLLFGLVLLTLPTTGRDPNGLMFVVMLVLCGLVLLSFGRLRVQLYGMLEPARLLADVTREFTGWTKRASRSAKRSPTASSVAFNRARAAESLAVLRDLCRLIRDRERKAAKVPAQFADVDLRAVKVSQVLRAIWLVYAGSKQDLIRHPGWCPPRAEHRDWLLGAGTEVAVALATATQLSPNEVNDTAWVERTLAAFLAEHLAGRDAGSLIRLVVGFDDVVRHLLALGMFTEARLWMEAVVEPAKTLTNDAIPAKETEAEQTNLVDFVASAYGQAVLGLRQHAQLMATDFPRWAVKQAHGDDVRFVGPKTAKLLASLSDGFAFEQQIEGRRISSDVDIGQFAARTMSTEVIDEVNMWMAAFETELWPWANGIGDGDTLVAGAVLSRVDEAAHKWSGTLDSMSMLFERCEAEHRNVDDVWPDLSLEKLRTRLQQLRDQMRYPIARLATRIGTDLTPDRPDMFGWAFQRAHQDLLDGVLSGRELSPDDLDRRLRSLVAATERAGARLRKTLHRQHYSVLGSVWSEPNLMLFQLSGAAFTLSLIRPRPRIFEVFAGVWGRLLDADPQQTIDVAVFSLAMDDPMVGLTPGGLQRTTRLTSINAALTDVDIKFSELPQRTQRLLHHVRACNDFEDVFVAGWLFPQAIQRGAVAPDSLPPRLADLVRSLAEVELQS